jgi:orotate phosphoribosyltransferase
MPIAYGLCEALRAHQVYWAEQPGGGPMRFRQFLEQVPREKVLLVDSILRTGRRLTQLKNLVESNGATVVGIAVAAYQPSPVVADFPSIPLFHLVKLDALYYRDAASCELCRKDIPVQKIWA